MFKYNEYYKLNKALEGMECWNSSVGSKADIPEGNWVFPEYASASNSIVVRCASTGYRDPHADKLPVGGIKCNDGICGYRFIVPSKVLAEAIGENIPENWDAVGDIMRYESGDMSEEEEEEFGEKLIETGLIYGLQGSYGRRFLSKR